MISTKRTLALAFSAEREDSKAALEQTERIIASSHFRNSKHCVLMLHYIVVHALEGKIDSLKERTIGIEVFERPADYDMSSDPVVRITAGEIRKRLVLYYHDIGHEQKRIIELPVGSYLPEFHDAAQLPPTPKPDTLRTDKLTLDLVNVSNLQRRSYLRYSWILLGCALAALACVLLLLRHRPAPVPPPQLDLDAWWSPVLSAPGPLLICIGEASGAENGFGKDVTGNDKQNELTGYNIAERVPLSDAIALSSISSYMGVHGRGFRVISAKRTKIDDLVSGPIVLISAFTNDWVLRLTDPLRYHFTSVPSLHTYAIEDRQDPAHARWQIHFDTFPMEISRDYAIVARYHDKITGEPVVIAAGIGTSGTVQAGEFLTNSHYFDGLASRLHGNWTQKNIEAVITTQVIDGQSGPPEVVAVYEW